MHRYTYRQSTNIKKKGKRRKRRKKKRNTWAIMMPTSGHVCEDVSRKA